MMITTWLMSVFETYENMESFEDPDSNSRVIFKKANVPTLTCIGGLWTNGFTYVNGTTPTLGDSTASQWVEYHLDKMNGLWTCSNCQTSGISLFEPCCGKALSFDEVCQVIRNEDHQIKF